uniref:Uncharacterized protein n=1 Tax=Cynoglossus semilaevis TaxID=244447 RepID=A0A3P8WPZ2_CYNSE
FLTRRLFVYEPVFTLMKTCQLPLSLLSGVQWVDAGDGHVVAIGQNQQAFRLTGSGWSNLGSRRLEHVTVGAAGVWGTDESKRVYKYISDDFEHVPGESHQVDAGGDGAVVGIRLGFFGFNSIACLKKSFSTSVVGDGQLQWKTDSMLMKYISCGPQLGCWGVNMNRIYFTEVRRSLKGHRKHVPGPNMNMIKVGRDGEVFGLSEGSVFRRVHLSSGQDVKHLTYDQDQLWVVTTDSLLLKCSGARSSSVLMMIVGSLIVSLLFH